MYSVLLPWTAAKVLTLMDGAFKTYTSLHRNLTPADLDFLIFVQRNKIVSALCNLLIKNLKPPFDTLIITIKYIYLVEGIKYMEGE